MARKFLAFVLAGSLLAFTGAAFAADEHSHETPQPPRQKWSFAGPFGTFDRGAMQRGLQVYKEVCAACHGLTRVAFRNLREQYVTSMLEGIVNFEIKVTRLETRWKLSQNRGRREQELIAAQLEQSADTTVRALAALTRKHLAPE